MNDVDVIYWSRDMMLQRNDVDADAIYKAAKLAEEDEGMYRLLTDYAYYEGSEHRQNDIYDNVIETLERIGL